MPTKSEVLKKKFAKNLKKEMKKQGFTPKILSEETGISLPTISKYLTGKGGPNFEFLVLLTDVFDITASELLGF